MKKRIVSGIQPTGDLHIGNYFGAIQKWVKQQSHEEDNLFFLADLHSLTVKTDPATLRDNVFEMTKILLGAGLDAQKSIIFKQSDVPQHSELCWMLLCTSRMGWLERMPQYKIKAGENSERESVGLFAYPVLQAADVLLYDATHVPVGSDQKHHIELARDIATKFNSDTNTKTFIAPKAIIEGNGTRIMSLTDGTKKMSKSDESDMSRINLNDSNDRIAKKIKKAKSDMDMFPAEMKDLEDRPEATNLINITASCLDKDPQEVLSNYAGLGFGRIKSDLADSLISIIEPIRKIAERIDNDHVNRILSWGAADAKELAENKMMEVTEALGLRRWV